MLVYPVGLPVSTTHQILTTAMAQDRTRRGTWRRPPPARQAMLAWAHLHHIHTYTALAAGFGLGTVACWNVAVPDRAEDAQLIRGLRALDPGQRIGGQQHESYADPVVSLHIQGADLAQRVLDLPVMAELAYRFNTRYQRQGMALQRRWHNPLFAADLLAPS